MESKWATARRMAREWRVVIETIPESKNTHLWRALEFLIEGIEDVSSRRLSWAARWQVLLTGKLPEDL